MFKVINEHAFKNSFCIKMSLCRGEEGDRGVEPAKEIQTGTLTVQGSPRSAPLSQALRAKALGLKGKIQPC